MTDWFFWLKSESKGKEKKHCERTQHFSKSPHLNLAFLTEPEGMDQNESKDQLITLKESGHKTWSNTQSKELEQEFSNHLVTNI